MGEQARRLSGELRNDLTEDLIRLGLPAGTREEREQVDMIAQTEALGLAYLDGRYSSLDTIVDVLTRFAVGVLGIENVPAASRWRSPPRRDRITGRAIAESRRPRSDGRT